MVWLCLLKQDVLRTFNGFCTANFTDSHVVYSSDLKENSES